MTGLAPEPEAGVTRLRVLVLPPNRWEPQRRGFVHDVAPDPLELFDLLRRDGIETVLLDPGIWPWNPFAGRSTLLAALDPWRALRVLLRERRADAVLCVFEGPAAPLLLLRRLLRFRPPVVVWDLGLTESWKLRERILDLVVPRADLILALGSSQAPYIRARWPAARSVQVVGHRVDANFFRAAPPCPAGPVFAVGDDVGRDYATLIEAARGLDRSVVLKTRLLPQRLVDTLPDNVTLLGGWLSYRDLRARYAAASVVVVPLTPTLNASGVSAVLEAMAMQRPLVVSETAALRDFIVPGETCLAVPCGDAAALRAAIQRLLRDPALADRLARNGRTMVEARFTDQQFADTMAGALRQAVSAARAATAT